MKIRSKILVIKILILIEMIITKRGIQAQTMVVKFLCLINNKKMRKNQSKKKKSRNKKKRKGKKNYEKRKF